MLRVNSSEFSFGGSVLNDVEPPGVDFDPNLFEFRFGGSSEFERIQFLWFGFV